MREGGENGGEEKGKFLKSPSSVLGEESRLKTLFMMWVL